MKQRLLPSLLLLLLTVPCGFLGAQTGEKEDVRIIRDEKCGCDLFYVNGIETTKKNGLYGFRRADGTVIVPNKYKFVGKFSGGYCRVMSDDTTYGLIDTTGREVIPCDYRSIEYPSDGRILLFKNGRFGYANMEGEIVIPFQYVQAGSFSEGCAPIFVVVDTHFVYGTYIDTLGRQLFPAVYENVQPFVDGFAPVQRYQRWGFIDHSGKEVLPTVYEQITTMFDTLFFAGAEEGMALFDRRMKPLTPFIYTWSGGIGDNRIPVMRDEKYGFLNRQGDEVIGCEYEQVGNFEYGRAFVKLNGKYGIIDTTGMIILPIEYDYSTPKSDRYVYRDSLALVEKNGRYGYVDLDGKLVIPFYFDDAYQFSEGLASTRFQGRWGYIDTHGDVFMPFIFDLASPYRYGRAEVVYQGLVRKVDNKGRCVKNCKGIIAWRDLDE